MQTERVEADCKSGLNITLTIPIADQLLYYHHTMMQAHP